jgi:hypothetical protein
MVYPTAAQPQMGDNFGLQTKTHVDDGVMEGVLRVRSPKVTQEIQHGPFRFPTFLP